MAKVPRKLYKIGEVMEHSGLSRQTIHNYTMLGLIKAAARTRAGHRCYGEDVFEVLERIQELKPRYTLDEIRRRLKAGASDADVRAGADNQNTPSG